MESNALLSRLIVDECISLSIEIHCISFMFARRSPDEAVHALAKAVVSLTDLEDQVFPYFFVIHRVILLKLV